jgi:hypothetical protein
MVDVPVLLHWSYKDMSGVAKCKAIAMKDQETGEFGISEYYWFEGNNSCDCNRATDIGLTAESAPDLFWKMGDKYPDGSVVDSEKELGARCGDEIVISRVESLDPLIPSLDGEIHEP